MSLESKLKKIERIRALKRIAHKVSKIKVKVHSPIKKSAWSKTTKFRTEGVIIPKYPKKKIRTSRHKISHIKIPKERIPTRNILQTETSKAQNAFFK